MAKFHLSRNNGVTAVVPDEVVQRVHRLQKEAGAQGARIIGLDYRPTFTFTANPDEHPMRVYTGDLALMERLLEGHESVRPSGAGYVPFSNGIEYSLFSEYPEKKESAQYEMTFVTTLAEAIEAFGLQVPELALEH